MGGRRRPRRASFVTFWQGAVRDTGLICDGCAEHSCSSFEAYYTGNAGTAGSVVWAGSPTGAPSSLARGMAWAWAEYTESSFPDAWAVRWKSSFRQTRLTFGCLLLVVGRRWLSPSKR